MCEFIGVGHEGMVFSIGGLGIFRVICLDGRFSSWSELKCGLVIILVLVVMNYLAHFHRRLHPRIHSQTYHHISQYKKTKDIYHILASKKMGLDLPLFADDELSVLLQFLQLCDTARQTLIV